MFIKARATAKTSPEPQALAAGAQGSCSRHRSQAQDKARSGGAVRVRLEGAPWLSLRDRCGAEPHPLQDAAAPSARGRLGQTPGRGTASRGARASSWRSLSRLEVAMLLVLVALLAAVFRGARSEPLLASAPPDAPPSTTFISFSD